MIASEPDQHQPMNNQFPRLYQKGRELLMLLKNFELPTSHLTTSQNGEKKEKNVYTVVKHNNSEKSSNNSNERPS